MIGTSAFKELNKWAVKLPVFIRKINSLIFEKSLTKKVEKTLLMVLRFFSLLVTKACIGKPDGDIPHPFECVFYISCVAEAAYERHCPDGLHFNPALGQCVYPETYPCPLGKR